MDLDPSSPNTDGNNNRNSNNNNLKHTKLKITKSLTMRNLTPRDNVSRNSKKRRYIHHRDKSVGSAIPNSIRSYTPALIALIDHTKGLQASSALASYGLNRPSTARTMRDIVGNNGNNNGNKSIPLFSQSPPPDLHSGMVSMPTLSNAESNPSVVAKHGKQQSGTFLVNELSSDQAVYGM